jgi:sugar lactone lactonase YvrE
MRSTGRPIRATGVPAGKQQIAGREGEAMRLGILACACAAMLAAFAASASEVKTINPSTFYPEGPLWFNGKLYYVEYANHTVMTWDGKENRRIWKQDGCGPAAIIDTSDGNLLVSCYDSNTLVRLTPDGQTQNTIPADSEGAPFAGPNDFARDAHGGIYFSASGTFDTAAVIRGRIYYLAPDGSIRPVAYLVHYANGLALTDGGKVLLASEHLAGRVLRFDVREDGTLVNRRVFQRLRDIASDPPDADAYTGPDGLKVDSKGNVYICQYGGGRVLVTDAAGKLLRTIGVPGKYVTNVNIGATEDILYTRPAAAPQAAARPAGATRLRCAGRRDFPKLDTGLRGLRRSTIRIKGGVEKIFGR